ncbi:nuclease-related domain-containing protein [Ureibacillus sp. GCM10028918]|uniref:nuclease-related domain-containing protein n=1 Tax=Ureibacillus sp. GCM10028918 TaxID=3273429 RepID=UPI00361DB125
MWKREEHESIPLLEALIRRLPIEEARFFEEKLGREKSGFYGEQRLDKEWLDFRIQSRYLLLNGLKFENEAGFTHQIDTVFICPNFIFVLEAKNITGRIDIDDETNQCIRTRSDGSIEGFTNPIDQVRRHGGYVRGYLREIGVSVPVVCGVVFCNPHSIIGKVNARDVLVFQVSGLRYKVERLFAQFPHPVIDQSQMRIIAEKLIASRKMDAWKPRYDKSKLRKGVLCSRYNYRYLMQYRYGKWVCTRCGNVDCQAFYEALHDYRLLWGERISNNEFREFVGIRSEKTAYRLLRKLNLNSEGNFKNRRYLVPVDFLKMSGK